jgi:hypothetical protein
MHVFHEENKSHHLKKKIKQKLSKNIKLEILSKDAEVKGYSSFGCFFNVNGELDVLVPSTRNFLF